MTTSYWAAAVDHLRVDPVLAKLIEQFGPELPLRPKRNPFMTLARAIIGQQISVKAANSVEAKVLAHVQELRPENILNSTDEDLRTCGLSRQKIRYLKALSEAAQQEHLADHHFNAEDQAVLKHLTELPGIGVWTAEMFLIFHLGRPDVWPLGDVGLVNAVQLHYGQNEKMTPAAVTEVGETLRPYRTVATLYLWRSLDPHPVVY